MGQRYVHLHTMKEKVSTVQSCIQLVIVADVCANIRSFVQSILDVLRLSGQIRSSLNVNIWLHHINIFHKLAIVATISEDDRK